MPLLRLTHPRILRQAAGLLLWLVLCAGCVARPASLAPASAATATAAPVGIPTTAAAQPSPTPPAETAVTPIPLSGPADESSAEISGMAWYGETLILLPQYPTRVSDLPGGALLALSKATITSFLDGKTTGPLQPVPVPINSTNVGAAIAGFEGFEAVTFSGSAVFLTIEASSGGKMRSYLVRGEIAPDLSQIRLDADHLVEVPLDVQISNYSNEALLVDGDRLLLFYEANGAEFNPNARAFVYTLDLQPAGTEDLPALEYRLTDASTADASGRFWVINYFFPGDLKILPSRDPLAEQFGQGPTHKGASVVERLVELQLPPQPGGDITFSGEPPIQIRLADGQVARNWEGLARLDDRGFLLVTDKFPETIFAFLPDPE